MRAGQLNRRVLYQVPDPTPDRFGDIPSGRWMTVATWWAHVRSPTGREVYQAQALQATVTHMVTLRYDPAVGIPSPTGRLLLGTRALNIRYAVNVDERNRRVDLMCTEATSGTQA